MKSFRQFITEDTNENRIFKRFLEKMKKQAGLGSADDLPKEEVSRLKKLFDAQYKKPSTKEGTGISDIEGTDELGPEKRGGDSIKDREKKKRTFDQEKLDQRKLEAQERTKFKKTTKAERAKHIGKPTHISKKYGVKYIPPKSVPDSELTGPNTKGEIVPRRRAKRSIDVGRKPEKISDVKKKIDSIDAYNRRHKKAEYGTSTQAKNRYGGKSVQDSRGRWVPDPIEDGKPIKDGKSAKRRTSGPSVDDVKRNIPEPKKRKFKFGNIWNQFFKKKPSSYKPFGDKPVKPDFGKPTIPPTKKPPLELTKPSDIKPPKSFSDFSKKLKDLRKTVSKPPVVNQAEVSKDAADFTAEINRKRIKKIHKVSVAGPTTSPTGSSYTPKTPPKIEPVIRGSSGPKFDSAYDKRAPDSSNPLKKKTKTFKDMVSDSQKSISKTKQPKTLVSKLKTITRRNVTKWLRGTKDWGTGKSSTTTTKPPSSTRIRITKDGKVKPIRTIKPKTSSGNWDGLAYGAWTGVSGYQQEREKGSSQTRSVASGITQGAGTALGTQIVANIARGALKNAPVHPWIKTGAILGGSLWAAGESQRRSKKLFDYVAGPNQATKNKTANKNKTNTKAIPLLPGNKKKKTRSPNTLFSLSGSK